MHPVLALKEAVSQVALYLKGCSLDPRVVAILPVGHRGLVVLVFAPSLVHPEKHRCPVLALRAAGTGVDL